MVISIQILSSVGKVRRIFRFQAVFRDSASDCTTVTLDAPDLPAYVIVTDESLVSGLLTTMVITFVGDLANPSLLVLVRFPESKLSQSALAKDVIVVSQIASCYQPEN